MFEWIGKMKRLFSMLVLSCFFVTLLPVAAWADTTLPVDAEEQAEKLPSVEEVISDLSQEIVEEPKPLPEEDADKDVQQPETEDPVQEEEKQETPLQEKVLLEEMDATMQAVLLKNLQAYYAAHPIDTAYAPLEAVGRYAVLDNVAGADRVLDWAKNNVETFEAKYALVYDADRALFTTDHLSVAAQLSKLILDLIALGGDPADIGGRNYIHALLNVQKFSPKTGQFDETPQSNKTVPLSNGLALLAMTAYYGQDGWDTDFLASPNCGKAAALSGALGSAGLKTAAMKSTGRVVSKNFTNSLNEEWGVADDANNAPLLNTFWLLMGTWAQNDSLSEAEKTILTDALGYHLNKFWSSRYTSLSQQCELFCTYLLSTLAAGQEPTEENWRDLQKFALADGSFCRQADDQSMQPEATAMAAITLALVNDSNPVFTKLQVSEEQRAEQAANMQAAERDAQALAGLTEVSDLPVSGDNGSTIVWKSDNTDLVTDDGKLIPLAAGEPDQKVKLQALASLGTAVAKASLTVTVVPEDKTFPMERNYALLKSYYYERGEKLIRPGEPVAIWAALGQTAGFKLEIPYYGEGAQGNATYSEDTSAIGEAILDTIAAGGDPRRFMRQVSGTSQVTETDLIQELLDQQQENGALLKLSADSQLRWNYLRSWLALEAYFGQKPWGNEAAGTQLGRVGAYDYLLEQMQDFTVEGAKLDGARQLGNVLTNRVNTEAYFDAQCGAVLLFSRLVDDPTVLSDGSTLGERAREERDGLVKTLQYLASDDRQQGKIGFYLNDPRLVGFYISAMTAAGEGEAVKESGILDRVRNKRTADGTYYGVSTDVKKNYGTDGAMLMALSDLTQGRAALTELRFTGAGLSDAEAVRSDAARLAVPEEAVADLQLPTEGVYGSTLTWQSDQPAVIDTTGKVTRPAVGQAEALVRLKVIVQKGDSSQEAQFLVHVPAQEKAQLADLRSDLHELAVPLFTASKLTLPTVGTKGSQFRWSSDQPGILAADGQITLPSEETLVNLTVQASLGEYELSETYTVLVGKAHAETDSVTRGAYAVRERLNTYRAMSSSYWAVFSAKSLLEDRFDDYQFQLYNVRNHRTTSQWQCTDYGAVILQLIMQGDDPYNYKGVNYVQDLIDWINTDSNDGMGGWANPIFAALALHAAAADVTQITNPNNTYEQMVAYCRGRIQPTATNVEYGPDMSGWAMIVLANELDKDNDGQVDNPTDPLLGELETFFSYLRTSDKDHTWLQSGKHAALFEGAKGKAEDGYDVTLSAGCIVSGLMALKAAGVEGCDITSEDSPWKVQQVGIMDTLYNIHFSGGVLRYGQIPMEFGDAYYGDSIWRRCAVTPEKLDQLIVQAEAIDTEQYTEASVTLLQSALADAEAQQGKAAFGQAYFALQTALENLAEKDAVSITIYGDAVHGQIISPLTSHLAGQTAAELLAWAAIETGLDYQLDEAGEHLVTLDGLTASANQGWWCYQNGTRMDIPINQLTVKEGDSIVFKFCSDSTALPTGSGLEQHLLADDLAALTIGGAIDDQGRATGDVILPTAGVFGSVINWYSDKTFALDESGKVTRDANEDITVHLEARLSLGEQMTTKNFTVLVPRLGGGSSGGSTTQKTAVISVAGPVGSGRVFFPEQALEIEAGETAYSLLKKTGLSLVVDENTQYGVYVKAIDGLAEFDEGPDSGWMYRVNGKFPGYSAGLARISDGDTVEWLYTRNRGKDIGGYVPENGGTAGGGQVVTGMTEKVDKSGKAEVTLSEEAVNSLVEAIKDSAAAGGKVEIVTAVPEEARSVVVNIPPVILQNLSEAKQTTLVVTTDMAVWELDNQMIQLLQKEAGSGALQLCAAQQDKTALPSAVQKQVGSRPVFDLQIKAGGKAVTAWQEGALQVRLPYTLQKGEKAEDILLLYIHDGQAEAVPDAHYDQAQQAMAFAATHFSVFAIASKTADTFRFTDVPKEHWARAVIEEMVQKGLLAGRSDDRFAPEEPVTRAEMMVLLARLNGADLPQATAAPFGDVQPEAWYASAIVWAAERDIVHGVDAENFAPNAPITRQDLAVMLHNYIKCQDYALPVSSAGSKTFADREAIAAYAQPAVGVLQQAGLLSGKNGSYFGPADTTTRAEAAAVLARLSALSTQ